MHAFQGGQLEGRNNYLMQMYGEKAEQVDELRMDLADLKAMFRTQTQQLLAQIDQLNK